jgi:hypothetical protein
MKLDAIVAIALLTTLLIVQLPQRANSQAVIGLPVLETVVVGGVASALWVWYVNGQRHESSTYPVLPEPEAEVDRLGQAHQVEAVTAGTQLRAEDLCRQLAQVRGLTMKEVKHFRDNLWDCVMY